MGRGCDKVCAGGLPCGRPAAGFFLPDGDPELAALIGVLHRCGDHPPTEFAEGGVLELSAGEASAWEAALLATQVHEGAPPAPTGRAWPARVKPRPPALPAPGWSDTCEHATDRLPGYLGPTGYVHPRVLAVCGRPAARWFRIPGAEGVQACCDDHCFECDPGLFDESLLFEEVDGEAALRARVQEVHEG